MANYIIYCSNWDTFGAKGTLLIIIPDKRHKSTLQQTEMFGDPWEVQLIGLYVPGLVALL